MCSRPGFDKRGYRAVLDPCVVIPGVDGEESCEFSDECSSFWSLTLNFEQSKQFSFVF